MKLDFLFFIVLFLFSCDEVIEKNISNQELIINSPVNNLRTKSQELTFWWEAMEGARDYELQVVTPSFDSLTMIKLDTTQIDNKHVLTLPKGKYQWRIRAANTGYKTQYIYRSLEIQ